MNAVLELPAPPAAARPAAKRSAPAPAVPPWTPRPRPVRLGFVRLTDAAPLVAAVELGLFRRHGLSIGLTREIGWAAVRHRATFDGLDVVQAPGPLALAMTLGLGGPPCRCVAPLVLNLHGNAITLARHLREAGVSDGPSLAAHVFSTRRREPLTFAVVSRHSSHQFLLGRWLRAQGIDPRRDLRLVVLPPDQLVRNLAAGHLDGFCAGQPWNSLAVAQAGAWCPALSADLEAGHPEKVLLAPAEFAERRAEEFTALAAVVLEACAWCDSPEGRARLPAILARREYLDLPAAALASGLSAPFDYGGGRTAPAAGTLVFHRFRANEPTPEKARWMLDCLAHEETLPFSEKQLRQTALEVFPADLFRAAERLAAQSLSNQHG